MSTNLDPGQADRSKEPPQDRDADYARLVFRTPAGGTIVKDVMRPTALIGRIPGCNIQLVSDEIGMAHCLLTLDDGSLQVRDLRSRSGVCVNGSRVEISALGDGDRLQIGPFECTVEANLTGRLTAPVSAGDDFRAPTAALQPTAETVEISPSSEAGQADRNRATHSVAGRNPVYARLAFALADGRTTTKDILRHTTLIGSFQGCNIQLVSSEIAPAHCAVTLDGDVLRVRDLRSRVGTIVNGTAVDVCELKDGDTLRIGAFFGRVETNLLPRPERIARPHGPDIDGDRRRAEIDRLGAEILRWRSRAETLQDEQERLSQRLLRYEEDKTETAARQQQARQQLEQDVQELQKQKEKLLEDTDALSKGRAQLASQRSELDAGQRALREQVDTFEAVRLQHAQQQEQSTQRAAELERAQTVLKNEQQQLELELELERRKLEDERRKLECARRQIETDGEKLEAQRNDSEALNRGLESRSESMQSEQARVQEQEATAARRLAEVEQADIELQRQRDEVHEERLQLADRQTQFQSELQEFRTREQADREQARTIEDDRASLEQDRSSLEQERASLEQDRASLGQDRSNLEQKRAVLAEEKQQWSEQTAELDRIRRQVEQHRTDFAVQQQEFEQNQSELSSALHEFRDRQQQFQKAVGAFETERAGMITLSEELSRAKSEMTRELSVLNQQRAAFDSRCAQLEDERSRLQSSEQEFRERERQFQDDSASLQTLREQLAGQQELVSQRADEQKRRSEDLNKQRTQLETALTELRAGQKRLQADVEQTASLNEQLRKERDAVQAARERMERQRRQAANSAKDLERRLAEAGKTLHAERDRLESQQKALDERTALLNRRTGLLKDQVHDVRGEQSKLRDSKREFEADLRDLRLEYERLRAEAASVEEARGQLEHQRLECEETAKELDQLRVELIRQRGEIEKGRQRLDADRDTRNQKTEEDELHASTEFAHVDAGVSPPEFSVLRLLDDLRELQQRHERCRIERDELHAAQKQLERAVRHFGRKQQLFHERVASFESDWHRCKQLESRAARARADLDRLELKRDTQSQQFERERQQLQAERNALKSRLRRFREERKRLYEEVAAFQLKHDREGTREGAESEAPLERDLQKLVQLHEKFRTNKNTLHSNKKQLRAEVRRFRAKRRSCQEKCEAAQTGPGWIELRIQRAHETLSELRDRQHELKQRRERFRAERAGLRAERSRLESRLESLSARQQHSPHEQPASFNVEFDRLKGLHENATELLGRLEQALAALQARHEQLPASSDAVETACNNCREEMRVLGSERRRFRRATAALNTARERLEQAAAASTESQTDLVVAKALVARGIVNRFQGDWFLKGRFSEYHIDGYRVVDHLDTRSLGWLYRAIETATGRQVALKSLSERFADDPEIVARFEIEARTGTRLDHPHIVRTLEYDCVDNVHYLTMEFVEGINIREMVDLHGPLAYRQACDLAVQAAIGLQYMHDSGLVHRDVKPSNLLVTSDGRLKILDFGLTLVDGDEDEFSLAMIFGHDCLGTADYVAPEQARDSFAVDARADVYSLGCSLFFALTGTVPFAGQSVIEKLEAHRNGDSRAIRKLAPRIPGPVQAIVEKMMAGDPAARFQTASDVAAALAPWGRRVPAYFDFHTVLAVRAARTRRRLYRDANAIHSGEDSMQLKEVDPDSQPPLAVSRASGKQPESSVQG